jgi:hypothetical protein
MRECYSCGGREDECALPLRKPTGRRMLCEDCRALLIRGEGHFANRKVYTRATLLRRFARRQASPQGDLVDQLEGRP